MGSVFLVVLITGHHDNWLKGTEQLPEFRVISNYIRSSGKLKLINDLLYKDDRYKRLRTGCNDHTHYNFYHNVLYNDNKIELPAKVKLPDRFQKETLDIFTLHFANIFLLNDSYMSSTDYIDSPDCDMKPEPDSEYRVANLVQNSFNSIVKLNRPEIAAEILARTCRNRG